MDFVFYDIETTGDDAKFDQILQFAAVRTDAELNEIDRFETECRLHTYIVPSPKALQINKIPTERLININLPSPYKAAISIYRKLREWSPATFVGYNSIRFDERFLQQEFYRNLLPPYLTSCHNNRRADVMRAVKAAALYEPRSIVVPHANGKQVFKLERVAAENGCFPKESHTALDDTLTTLCLARLLSERAPSIWSAFIHFSEKTSVLKHLAGKLVVGLSDMYSGKLNFWPVTLMGENETRNTTQYVFSLKCDPKEFASMSDGDLEKRLLKSPRPVLVVKAGTTPILMPCDQIPFDAHLQRIDPAELEYRAKWLRNNEKLCQRLIKSLDAAKGKAAMKKYGPPIHVEQKLYEKFISREDESIMEAFHKAPWGKRPTIVETFADSRLRELGSRLIHCEHPEVLDDDTRALLDVRFLERIISNSENPPWLTLPQALEKIDRLIIEAEHQEQVFLKKHREYLSKRLDKARTALAHSSPQNF